MRRLKHKETLVYYDAPQVILACDAVGTQFVCLLVEAVDQRHTHLCVPVSNSRLQHFRRGELDLRSIFVEPEIAEYSKSVASDPGGELDSEPIQRETIPDAWLPADGFFMTGETVADEFVRLAEVSQRTVVELALNPPEARSEHVIRSHRLSGMLDIFQSALKHAFRRQIASMSQTIRDGLDRPENYQLDVCAFAEGSFKVVLQSVHRNDLLGYAEVEKALQKLDELTDEVDDVEVALDVVKRNKGHLANAYLRLLKYVSENDSPMSYRWTVPGSRRVSEHSLSREQAIALSDRFSQLTELATEVVEFVGRVREVDVDRRTWRIQDEKDGRSYSGFLSDTAQVSLAGIVVDAAVYRFVCEEHVEEVAGTGREKRRYLLRSYTTVQQGGTPA